MLTALIVPPLLVRIRAEALLRSELGGEYDAYRGRTSRLLPGSISAATEVRCQGSDLAGPELRSAIFSSNGTIFRSVRCEQPARLLTVF